MLALTFEIKKLPDVEKLLSRIEEKITYIQIKEICESERGEVALVFQDLSFLESNYNRKAWNIFIDEELRFISQYSPLRFYLESGDILRYGRFIFGNGSFFVGLNIKIICMNQEHFNLRFPHKKKMAPINCTCSDTATIFQNLIRLTEKKRKNELWFLKKLKDKSSFEHLSFFTRMSVANLYAYQNACFDFGLQFKDVNGYVRMPNTKDNLREVMRIQKMPNYKNSVYENLFSYIDIKEGWFT